MGRERVVGNLEGFEGIKVVCDGDRCWPRQYDGTKVKLVKIGKRTIVAYPKSKKGQGKGKGNTAQKEKFGAAAKSCAGLGKGVAGFRECMHNALNA